MLNYPFFFSLSLTPLHSFQCYELRFFFTQSPQITAEGQDKKTAEVAQGGNAISEEQKKKIGTCLRERGLITEKQPEGIRIKQQVIISRSPGWWVSNVWIDRTEAEKKKYGISTISKIERRFNNRRSGKARGEMKAQKCCWAAKREICQEPEEAKQAKELLGHMNADYLAQAA